MSTVLPPPSKRQKLAAEVEKQQKEEDAKIPEGLGSVRIQFIDQATGQATGAPVSLPVSQATPKNLELLLNSLQGQDGSYDNPKVPYRFTFLPPSNEPSTTSALDITTTVYHNLLRPGLRTTEDLITLHYTPLSIFRVRAVTRCAASIPGHGEPILAVNFSPASSSRMVSGSGDSTARIWDCETNTPFATLKGHTGWVLAVGYSPDGNIIATGSYDKTLRLWSAATGAALNSGKSLKGHTGYITSIAWEPYHLWSPGRPRLASASKDGTVRVWDAVRGISDLHLARHTSTVSCVRWGGGISGSDDSATAAQGIIYTSSHDKTVKLWDPNSGALIRSLDAHAHWVNHLALSTEFVLRTGFFDHFSATSSSTSSSTSATAAILSADSEKQALSRQRFDTAVRGSSHAERFVTASDDNTLYLWSLATILSSGNAKPTPIARLLGHQKPINHVIFSPLGTHLASASFDGHIKLWRASDGTFLRNLRGHVARVYMVAFSADGRLLVSGGKDMTIKVWDVETGKLVSDLPGHKGEVYAVDWSPDGRRVGSGSQDRCVRVWTH